MKHEHVVGAYDAARIGFWCSGCSAFLPTGNAVARGEPVWEERGREAKAIAPAKSIKPSGQKTGRESLERNHMQQQSTNPKDVYGRMKPPLHLIPPVASIHESMAMKDGAEKYGPYNWRAKTVAATVYIGACLRHLFAYQDGEINAADSGVHHLGHARACLGIILDAESNGTLVDDRPLPGKAAELLVKLTEDKNRPRSVAIQEIVSGGIPPRRADYVGSTQASIQQAIDALGWSKQDDAMLRIDGGNTFEKEGHFVSGTQFHKYTPTFYIAGPMRGYPRFNFPAFDEARDLGIRLRYNMISPADMDRNSGFHETNPPSAAEGAAMTRTFVERDTKALLSLRAENGDGIALLPGWEKSTGALAEFFIARWLGLKVVDARTFEPFSQMELSHLKLIPIMNAARKTLGDKDYQ